MKKTSPGAFLDLPDECSAYERARVVVLPLPLEETVSYGGGTAAGPQAIITASQQVELYDREFDSEPALDYGVHTLPVLPVFKKKHSDGRGMRTMLNSVATEVRRLAADGKFVLALGGEHTVSSAVFSGLAQAEGQPITVVHIDAHADLRDRYDGSQNSHACVMRRILEMPECGGLLQFGIRSLCREEMDVIRRHRKRQPLIRTWFAEDVHFGNWEREFSVLLRGRRVFLSFDVDGLDPSIMPATGTPEPEGITCDQILWIAELIARHSAGCVGMDCLELAPAPGLHYAEFTAAKLLYRMLNRLID